MRFRVIITAIAIVALAAVSVSDAFAGSRYRTYTTCGLRSGPDRSCSAGQGWGGVFKDRNGGKTHYRLCVNPPPGASKKCERLKTHRKGKGFALVVNWYRPGLTGTYEFTWKKGGRRIDKDAMRVHF
jgi:hypothetical protein